MRPGQKRSLCELLEVTRTVPRTCSPSAHWSVARSGAVSLPVRASNMNASGGVQSSVPDAPAAPQRQIAISSVISSPRYPLKVARLTALVVPRVVGGVPKVRQLRDRQQCVLVPAQQDVLRLKVQVQHVPPVQPAQALHDVLKQAQDLLEPEQVDCAEVALPEPAHALGLRHSCLISGVDARSAAALGDEGLERAAVGVAHEDVERGRRGTERGEV